VGELSNYQLLTVNYNRMCFHSQQSKSAQTLEKRFDARFEQPQLYVPKIYNGFEHPRTAVITNDKQDTIQLFEWGLIPEWAKDKSIQKSTLNARVETLNEKPSFRGSLIRPCLIPADGFFEWQWLDAAGKKKQKYFIHMPNNELYAYAGLWSMWKNGASGETLHTYTIITTEANALMAQIHNTKKRMPIIVNSINEKDWLNNGTLILGNEQLMAEQI